MDLSPRDLAFIKSEMNELQEDDTCQPTARVQASRIAEEVDSELTE